MKVTIKEFQQKTNTDYLIASNLLRYLTSLQKAKVVDKISKGRGKPTLVYEVDEKVELNWS